MDSLHKPIFSSGTRRKTLLLGVLGLVLGCQRLRRFKAQVREPSNQAQPQTGSPEIPADKAGLEVQVSPGSGMSVLLDGNVLGHRSPVIATDLTPGAHTLWVRAMGHYPLSLPVHLIAGQKINVPVFLRARASQSYNEASARTPKGRQAHAPAGARAEDDPALDKAFAEQSRSNAPFGAQSPPATAKLWIQIQAEPEAPIYIDGHLCDTQVCPVFFGQGQLQIGAAQLRYSINPEGILVIFIPADNGLWSSNDTRIKTGSTLFAQRQTLHLKRQAEAEGDVQKLTVKRLESAPR